MPTEDEFNSHSVPVTVGNPHGLPAGYVAVGDAFADVPAGTTVDATGTTTTPPTSSALVIGGVALLIVGLVGAAYAFYRWGRGGK